MVEAQQYYEAQKCKGGGGKCPSLSIQALLFGRYKVKRDRAVRSTVDLGVSVRQCQKRNIRKKPINNPLTLWPWATLSDLVSDYLDGLDGSGSSGLSDTLYGQHCREVRVHQHGQ